jgi:hypothetical protein
LHSSISYLQFVSLLVMLLTMPCLALLRVVLPSYLSKFAVNWPL